MQIRIRDPASCQPWIRDRKKSDPKDPGAVINIPDPQHWYLLSGLALKNPPKKTHQKKPKKTHLKKPTKNVFFGVFLKTLIFYENNTNFSLSN
jgi:hypothetical protein